MPKMLHIGSNHNTNTASNEVQHIAWMNGDWKKDQQGENKWVVTQKTPSSTSVRLVSFTVNSNNLECNSRCVGKAATATAPVVGSFHFSCCLSPLSASC